MEAIKVEHLSFGYTGDVPILEDVNLKIEEGDYVILTGENGSGKSTFLKLLLGQLEADQGRIELLGRNIATGKFRGLKVGYVPQNSISGNQDFPATVEEVVRTGLYRPLGKRLSGKECNQRVKKALQELGMEEFAKHRIGELSGGQQQRVMLARVMADEPKLLILDEPTVGVDSSSIQALCEILEKKHKEGLTILMVTHGNTRIFVGANRHLRAEEGGITE